MPAIRRIHLFRNGRNQAVRIPREFELPGDEAFIYKEGTRIVIEPLAQPSLARLLDGWKALDFELPEVADQPPRSVDF